MKHRRKKILKSMTLAFAVAVVAAPVAGARPYLSGYNASAQQARDALNQIGSSSTSYSPQALRALELRSEGMNQRYTQVALNRPDDRAGVRGPISEAVVPDAFSREVTKVSSGSAAISHADDRAGARGPGFVRTPVLVSAQGDGFSWSDAGIGAGTALASALILLGSVAVTRRTRQSTVAA
jgi:hypothetical protein